MSFKEVFRSPLRGFYSMLCPTACHRMRQFETVRALFLFIALTSPAPAEEWPQYRGPNHDGVSRDRIRTSWVEKTTNAVWKTADARFGYSSFAVAGGRAVTQARRTIDGAQKEVCVAFDAATGAELWARAIDDATYTAGAGADDGPRTTPSIDAEGVYVLCSGLKLMKLDAAKGTVLWSTNLLSGYGGTLIQWQNAASPLLDSGLIFVNANCGSRTLLALKTIDGSLAWRSQEGEAMTHSTPVVASIHGVKQIIFATQRGLISLEPASGKRLWSYAYPFRYSTSLAVSPVVHGDIVFVSAAYNMGAVAVKTSFANGFWSVAQLWRNDLASHWMTPVCYEGYLYGHFGSDSYCPLKCVSLETGEEMWSVEGFGRAGALLVSGHLAVLAEDGTFCLVRPSPEAYVEINRFQAVSGKCWNSPAVADGRVYLRSSSQAACYDLSVPQLKLDPPRLAPGGGLELYFRIPSGDSITDERLAGIELLATEDLNIPVAQWTQLTNALILTNGSGRFSPVDAGAQGLRFFRVLEQTPGL